MPATTIKLESDLVDKVCDLKTDRQSVSAFVRNLIEKEYHERRMREAARSYQAFLDQNPAEQAAMDVWESAPLTDVVEPKSP